MKWAAFMLPVVFFLSGCGEGIDERNARLDRQADIESQVVVIVCLDTDITSHPRLNIDREALADLPDHEVVSRRELYRGASKRYSGKQNVVSGEDGDFVICWEVTTRRKTK